MLFNSLEFAIFFPIVVVIYFAIPHRARTLQLLIASCVFYMAFIPAYILILALTIVIDYFAGRIIERSEGRQRLWVLRISIVATCLVLLVFKYFYFVTDNVVGLVGVFGWQLTGPSIDIILPIGLSFHTFQSLSYVIEVYRRHQKAERDFITYAAYVMFFPQLVAGPIERPQNLLHQFHEEHYFDYARVVSGLKRMAWGFFKKLVIADRLALYVNDVYGAPQDHNGPQLVIATLFFAYQIYCDFSGYSDIAIGSARILGFKLMENFDRPYASRSIGEFWKRWHISLSTWFRDYVYIPLGGNRVKPQRLYANLLITFAISGIWHGANWTYIAWGVLNGAYLVIGEASRPARARILEWSGLRMIRSLGALGFTFSLTCMAWVLFRANSISDAWYIWTHLFVGWDAGTVATKQFLLRQMPVAIGAIAVLEIVQYPRVKGFLIRMMTRQSLPVRWMLYASGALAVIMLGVYRETQFIYFQF